MLDRKMKLCYDISCVSQACVAQLDRASGYGPEGRGFESCRTQKKTMKRFIVFFSSYTPLFAAVAYLVLESALQSYVEIKPIISLFSLVLTWTVLQFSSGITKQQILQAISVYHRIDGFVDFLI